MDWLSTEAENFFNFSSLSGLASIYPEPADKKTWLQSHLYNFNYESSMPVTWNWPKAAEIKTREIKPTKLQA
jgi:malate dehydrogenase (oxaloacetate-decarboxylating)(NADP+)